ncbi:MAG TPA: BsuPI-related putative proteinase inhibitor [Longimicrobium sp.]|nr:BsuPI-related putative proteinase inhibitor [Longimicrobium sp.]
MMLRRSTTALLAIALAVSSAACGRERAATAEAERDSAAAAGPLVLLLDVPATVRAGEEVTLAVTLVNRGSADARVGGAAPDVVVTREDGTEVWRRSRHEPQPASAAPITLRPKEMRGSGHNWNQRDDAGRPVPPGTYRVRAEFPAPKLASEPRTITIQP